MARLEGVEVVHAARDVAADARRRRAPGHRGAELPTYLVTHLLTYLLTYSLTYLLSYFEY